MRRFILGLAAAAGIVRTHRGWIGINWPELLRYRELLSFLVWRDIKVIGHQAFSVADGARADVETVHGSSEVCHSWRSRPKHTRSW